MTPRQIWIEALRSDRFSKCQNRLHKPGIGHCCLGVLCEVYIENGGELKKKDNEGWCSTYDGEATTLPTKVADWVGLRSENGQPLKGIALTDLNDRGIPFDMIANVLEADKEGYFDDGK